MILGIGNDIVDISRIERALSKHGTRFEERCFTKAEQARAHKRQSAGAGAIASVYAKRFAAKEACAKALGTGFSDGVIFRDIGVIEDEAGRPFLTLFGGAQKKLQQITPAGTTAVLHLSLSDDMGMALAFVIIECHAKNCS